MITLAATLGVVLDAVGLATGALSSALATVGNLVAAVLGLLPL